MADSYLDLGSAPQFPIEPNWIQLPQTNLEIAHRVISYPGTAHDNFSIGDDVPISFSAKFTLYSHSEFDTFMDFFHARRGRNGRFWIKHPRQHFTLKTNASSGASSMVMQPNKSNLQWQGYERIIIIMNTGDEVTRKVTAATYSTADDDVTLTLNNALDRDITTSNYSLIGRYLLARFDKDVLDMVWLTSQTCEFTLNFYELVREYDDA